MKTRTRPIVVSALLAVALSTLSTHAAVLTYEGFYSATQLGGIGGFSDPSYSTGLSGSWSRTRGSGESLISRTSDGNWNVAANNVNNTFRVKNTIGATSYFNQVEDNSYNVNQYQASLASPVSLGSSPIYISYVTSAKNGDFVGQAGLANSSTGKEITFGQGWNQSGSHYSTSASVTQDPGLRGNTTSITISGWQMVLCIGKLTQSGTMYAYNLSTISSPLPTTEGAATALWTQTLTGVSETSWDKLEFVTSSWSANNTYPSIGQIRVATSWESAMGALTVPVNEVWNGGGSDNKWSTGANWTNGVAPSPGDYVIFAGATQTTANMDTNYSVGSLTFDGTAGSFNITNAANTLTLAGGLTNNSTSAQTVAVPVVLSGSPIINAASGNVTLSGVVSGGGLTVLGSGNTVTLSGVNTYSGNTVIQNGILVLANPSVVTNSGAISGGAALVKSGAGVLTLTGANNFSGTTTVSNGTLLVTTVSNQSLGSVITVVDGATFGVKASADASYLSPSSLTVGGSTGAALQFGVAGTTTAPLNPASLTLNGTTTISISSCPFVNNTSYPLFTGYSAGTLVLGSQPARIQGKLTVSGSTVSYMVTNLIPDIWTAAVNTNWDTTTANWNNALAGNLFAAGDPVRFDDSANGTSPLLVNITGNVFPGTVVVDNTTKSYVIGGLAISGSTGIAKSGNNTLTLTGTNTFTGPLTVSAGTVEIGGAGLLGGGNYAGQIANDATLRMNTTSAQTLSGAISGTGVLVQASASTLTLAGTSTFSGGTVISNGVIALSNGAGLGAGIVTLNGGTLQNAAGIGTVNDINVGPAGGTIKLGNTSDYWVGGNLSGPGNLILGGSSPGVNSLNVNFGANTMSGGSITIPLTGNNQTVVRFKSATSGNAGIPWSVGGAPDRWVTLDFGTGTIEFGALTGAGILGGNGAGTKTVQVGGLNTDSTFTGKFMDGSGVLTVNKVGTGKLTLAGTGTAISGGITLTDGILNLGSANPVTGATAFTFAGGMLQFSAVNQGDYGSRIANSGSPILIDLNGTNVTFATAIPNSNYGGLVLTNSTGTGKLTLTANNLYSGDTFINAGTLALGGSGNISATANIVVGSGGVFDVSAATSYILGNAQTISGIGTVTGAVTTASSGATISPAGAGTAGTLTFKNNLFMNTGGSAVFDLSGNHLSGNDRIVVNGNLKLSTSDTIHINAMTGGGNLDQSGDYVLFSVTGSLTLSSVPVLVFDSPSGDAANWWLMASGNNMVLHYSVNPPPTVSSVTVTNIADGSTIVTRGQSVTVYAVVQKTQNNIGSVTVDLSPIGGSSTQPMTLVTSAGSTYEYSYGPVVVGPSAVVGANLIGVAATDTSSSVGTGAATLTVNPTTETWSGLAVNDNWGSAANWTGGMAPGYSGDTLIFTGSTRLTPNLEVNYDVASLTFDGAADVFTIGSTSGKSLTLSGPLYNNSSNPQTITTPVVMTAAATITDSGAGTTLAGPVSGLGLTVSSGTVTLVGSNTYSGDTVLSVGTLKAANTAAIPSGAGKGNVVLGAGTTFDVNGTNVFMNGLSGSGGIDNTGLDPATLTVGNGNASSTFTGWIVNSLGAVKLVKVGSGAFTFGNNNLYSGGTEVRGGSIVLPNGTGAAFGSGSVTLSNGTIVVLAGGGGSWNSPNACYIGNNLVIPSGTTNVIDDSVNNYGNLWVGGDGVQWTGTGTLKFQNNGSVNQPGLIWSGSPLATFNGTIVLGSEANNNSFVFNGIAYSTNSGSGTGGTVTSFDSAGTAWNMGDVGYSITQVNDGACTNMKMGSITGSNPNSILRGTTFEVGALNTSTTFNGKFTTGGAGMTALTKVGSGSLTLLSTGNNYAGPTIVDAGTLLVNGAITSPVTVNGGTFGGTGSVTASVLVNSGGTLSPGASIGTLTINGNLSLSGNTLVELNKSLSPAQSNDFVNVTGTLTYGGTLTVNNLGPALSVGNSFRIFPSGGTGSLTVVGNPGAGLAYSFNDGVLSVVSSGPTGGATITNSIVGNTLQLSWPAGQGWRLVSQTNSLSVGLSATGWGTVSGTADGSYSITIDKTKPTVFYRLVNP